MQHSCRSQIAEALGRHLAADVVVTMGCNVQCPSLPCKWREDWGLDDPTGQMDPVFAETIQRIEEKELALREKLR